MHWKSWRFSWFLLRNHLSLNDMDSKFISDIKKNSCDWQTEATHSEWHAKENYLLASILDTCIKALKFLPSADWLPAFDLFVLLMRLSKEEQKPEALGRSCHIPGQDSGTKDVWNIAMFWWGGENPNGHEGEKDEEVEVWLERVLNYIHLRVET